jgi:hypothetical protein
MLINIYYKHRLYQNMCALETEACLHPEKNLKPTESEDCKKQGKNIRGPRGNRG